MSPASKLQFITLARFLMLLFSFARIFFSLVLPALRVPLGLKYSFIENQLRFVSMTRPDMILYSISLLISRSFVVCSNVSR